jgi:uncharacterized membrane protein YdbT with pleckstrin-like domain
MSNDQPVAQDQTTPSDLKTSNIYEWHYSGKALRGRCLLTWLATILLAIVGFVLTFNAVITGVVLKITWAVIVLVIILVWLHFFCTYWYRTKTILYRLTENRLEKIEGIFTRQTDPMELLYITDIRLEVRLIDRIINGGVGQMIVFSSSDKTDSTMLITAIENSHEVYEKLDTARCKVRSKRGFVTS